MVAVYSSFPAFMKCRDVLQAVIDFFFPPQCLLCRSFLASYREGYFCATCRGSFSFTSSPLCPKCGIMFKSREGEDHVCSRCMEHAYAFDTARAMGAYDGMLRRAIHLFKYANKSMLAEPLGRLLAEHGAGMVQPEAYDLIVPVPLHPQRLRERGYNQALMLGRALGRAWNITVRPDSLRKIKRTEPQTTLSAQERWKNVRGAFCWTGAPLHGKKILLVDDVYTSGSTAHECAGVLKKAGATQVDVLTLARTH